MDPIQKQIINNLIMLEYYITLHRYYAESGLEKEATETHRKIAELYFVQNELQDAKNEIYGNEESHVS